MLTAIVVPDKPSRAILKTAASLGAAVLALPFAMAAWHAALGAPLPWPLHVVLTRLPAVFPIHMATAGSALLLVPLTIACVRIPFLHRAIGRLAVLAIGIGGASALVVAPISVATPLARAGFFAQALVWLGLATAGVVAIRRERRWLHTRLMTATAIVTFAPVLLRVMLHAAVRHRWPFAPTYTSLAWGSWLVPLTLYAIHCMPKRRRSAMRVS